MNIGNSFNTQTINYMDQNKTNTEETLSKIGAVRELSGKDGADLIISDSLSYQISTLTQNIQNENESIAMNQIADSSVQALSQSTDRLNQLSVANNNAALNSSQKDALSSEFQATVDSMQDIVDTTQYNDMQLLSSSGSLEVSGLDSLSIDNQEGISSFASSLDSLSSTIGSNVNQSSVSISNSLSAVSSLTNSYANISEEPMDTKISDLKTDQIKLDSSILAQTHQTQMLQQRMTTLLV
jgi:flagellin